MKNAALLLFLFIIHSELLIAQQKLPTYAIRTQYTIDAIRDTLGPKAGGVVKESYDIYKDSVLFHYNSKGLLEREQIYRTQIVTAFNPPDIKYPDTSRYFRQHLYDTQGRKISVRHGKIIGSPNPDLNEHYGLFPDGAPDYTPYITRIDSIAYDSHGSQLFNRRYEPYDFDRGNLNMVVKNPTDDKYIEYEFDYDNLGRIFKERRFRWGKNLDEDTMKRVQLVFYGDSPFEYTYYYVGNSNKIRSRRFKRYYPERPGEYIPSKDTLFKYDSKERIVSFRAYPLTSQQGVDYTKQRSIDSTLYFDKNGSYQNRNSYRSIPCIGKVFDAYGRMKYTFNSKIDIVFQGIDERCGGWTVPLSVHHYTYDNNGLVLAQDSTYEVIEWGSRYCESNCYSYVAFDTISYHGFVDAPLAIEKSLNKSIEKVSFAYYPNPAQDYFTFHGKQGNVLQVYDMYGMEQMGIPILYETQKIDIAELPKGIYLLQYGGQTKKLIKQ